MKQNKNQEKEKYRGKDGFNRYYNEIFFDRWDKLKSALLKENIQCSLTFQNCESYFLDPASICVALCLPIDDAENVIDLCAAPGGKTLVLSSNLPSTAALTANERSGERKSRLTKVINQSLPKEISSRIKITCSDGATLCKRENSVYESILLDAPCSSERHVLKDEKYLSMWSPSRLKTMAMEQWALLSSAWRILAPKGFLTPKENDESVAHLIKKFSDVKILEEDFIKSTFLRNLNNMTAKNIKIKMQAEDKNIAPLEEIFFKAEKTNFGFHILPDTSSGFGPLFFSLLQKN